jgi:hypothetical protein
MTTPLKVQPRRFSHSLVETFLGCPRKAYYRYVENVPSPKSAALVRGSACDDAWTQALQDKIDGTTTDLESVLEITEQSFRDDVKGEGGVDSVDWGKDGSARKSLDSAIVLSRTWHRQLYPDIQPTAVQVRYSRTLASGREFIGFADYEGQVDDVPNVIGDNKTGSRRLFQGDADRGLQPSAYGWLRGEETQFVFTRVIDTGKSQYSEKVWTKRSVEANDWYGQLVEEVEGAFVSGNFPPNPSSNYCGRFCPYLAKCMPFNTTR